jgi:hypothetical protein
LPSVSKAGRKLTDPAFITTANPWRVRHIGVATTSFPDYRCHHSPATFDEIGKFRAGFATTLFVADRDDENKCWTQETANCSAILTILELALTIQTHLVSWKL